MSEQDRSRLYDWWCEHADEALAEYAMSCLSPVPLPDLATKADVLALKEDFARLDVRVDKLDAKFDRLVDAREADRENSRTQFHWLIGLGATGFGVLLAAMFALAAVS